MSASLDDLQRKIRKAKREIRDEALDGAEHGARDMKRSAQQHIVSQNAVASSQLLFGFRIFRRNSSVILSNGASHAGYVEFGTGVYNQTSNPLFKFAAPSLTPSLVEAIKVWMRMKGVPPQKGSFEASASAISAKIAEFGTRAKPFMRPAYSANKERTVKHVANNVKRLF